MCLSASETLTTCWQTGKADAQQVTVNRPQGRSDEQPVLMWACKRETCDNLMVPTHFCYYICGHAAVVSNLIPLYICHDQSTDKVYPLKSLHNFANFYSIFLILNPPFPLLVHLTLESVCDCRFEEDANDVELSYHISPRSFDNYWAQHNNLSLFKGCLGVISSTTIRPSRQKKRLSRTTFGMSLSRISL